METPRAPESNNPAPGSGLPRKRNDALKPRKKINWAKGFGYGFLIFGGLSILDFFSPIPIPTTFGVAFASGLFFIALGSVLLLKDKLPWGKLASRAVKSLSEPPAPEQKIPAMIDPMLPVKILKLAKERKGILTASMVAMELEIPLDQVEAGLNECIRYGHAMADFDMTKEITIYRFHEHLENDPEKEITEF
jgi:hypothetical protein